MRFTPQELKRDGKIIHLLNDFVINHDVCNMHCAYCMTTGTVFNNSSSIHREGGKINWNSQNREMAYEDDSTLKKEIDTVSDNYLQFFDAPLLKISGGEILLIKNICKYLAKEAGRYESIQILTNGFLLNRKMVRDLAAIPNLHIQMSLDGHTFAMNRLRAETPAVHEKLLAALDRVVQYNIPVEIFCVLTRQNTKNLRGFADYLLANYKNKVGLTCFPVRHETGQPFLPLHSDISGLHDIISNFERYRGILPPIKYMEHMMQFLVKGQRRNLRCMVPYFMVQTFFDGTVTPCPFCWAVKTGHLLKTPEETAATFGMHPTYHMRTTDPPWAPFCRSCWTDAAVYTLYFNDTVSMEELCHNRPILNGDKVRQRLEEFKSLFAAKIQLEEGAGKHEKNHAH